MTSPSRLVLCDGIGQYDQSDLVAHYVADAMMDNAQFRWENIDASLLQIVDGVKSGKMIGGTTLLYGEFTSNEAAEFAKLLFLGNGGIIHLPGDFARFKEENCFYLYHDLFTPNVDGQKRLTCHLSYNSGPRELRPVSIELPLTRREGDILLFHTDGINSMENNIVLQDNTGRHWRNESTNVQFILGRLDTFLMNAELNADFQSVLDPFAKSLLDELKVQEMLSDDAALGIAISDKVIEYYSGLRK